MQVSSFVNFARGYASGMGKKNINVTFGGDTAYTDGNTINLPALPADVFLSPWEVEVFSGYLDHELAHIRYTDFRIFPTDQPLKQITNLMEDIRIENRLIQDFPGTKKYLDACGQQIEYDRTALKKDAIQGPKTMASFFMEILYVYIYEVHRDSKISYVQTRRLSEFPQFKDVQDLLDSRLPSLNNTKESVALAKDLLKIIPMGDYSTEAPSMEDSILPVLFGIGSGSSKSPKQQQEMMQALVIAASALMEETDRRCAQEEFMGDLEAKGLAAPSSSDSKGSKSQSRITAEMPRGGVILPPVGTHHDKIYSPSKEDILAYQTARDEASAEITSVKRMLQIYLKSRDFKSWERGQSEGKLDDAALANFPAGDMNLFKIRRSRSLVNSAIDLCVDCSGSMDEDQTRTAAILLAEAMSGVPQLKLSISGFTTNNHSYSGSSGGRSVGMDLKLYKDFDESYQRAKGKIGAMTTSNYTPLGEAYAHSFSRLMQRKETRRILWLITDGQPYFPLLNRSHDEYALMSRVYRKCKFFGIKTIIMNIGGSCGDTAQYCDATYSIRNQRDMPTEMLKILKGISR